MKIKPGVSLKGVRAETVAAMYVVDGCYRRVCSTELVVTAVTDGTHKPGSLHYVGLAFDGRTRDIPLSKLDELLAEINSSLGGMEFDAILESDHLHVEFQPKH